MDAQRFEKILELFELAKALSPESRDAFLQKECGDDVDLLREVRDILAADSSASSEWIDGEIPSRIMPPKQMAFSPGAKLGTYEIVGLIGVGGMGEVYRARDSKLKREVAIKVLHGVFAQDADRVARFQREAEILASVSHAHIGAIYDIVTFEKVQFLVLELVEGETLADWIERGPIPLAEALRIANQIAEALETAHEKRIIHRDLKPANIKLTSDGNVKVLDFGLARLYEPEDSVDPSRSPTQLSERGTLVGTVAYMSPEQVKGQVAHRTSDVWAFGCVLYEMLTGKPPFDGETAGETLAEILKTEPDWTRLPSGTPEPIRRMLRRCLRKDRKSRLHDIADARLEIEESQNEQPAVDRARPLIQMGRREWIVATSAAAVAGAAGWWIAKKTSSSIPVSVIPPINEIRIGAYASLTGNDRSYGISTRVGFEMAFEEQKRAGGILNLPVHLILKDDMGDEKEANAVVHKLIDQHQVIALLGEFKSGLSSVGANVAQPAGVPMISHGSTNWDVTQKRDYIFRVCFTDKFQGWAMAKFAREQNFKIVAVLHDDNDYSIGLADAFTENFAKTGTIEGPYAYSGGVGRYEDFTPQLNKILSSKAQAVFVPGYYKDVILIAQQAEQLGLKIPFLGGDGWDSAELLEKAGDQLNGSYCSNHYFADSPKPNVPDFLSSYLTRNRMAPDAVAALAYDAAKVLFHSIKVAQSADPKKIRNAIERTMDFPGVTGNISIDENRNARKPAVILQVKNRRFNYMKTIPPDPE